MFKSLASIAACSTLALTALVAAPASASPALTPYPYPKITMEPTGHMIVPGVVSTVTNPNVYQTQAQVRWTTTAVHGVCDVQAWNDSGRAYPYMIADLGTNASGSANYSLNISSGDLDQGNGGYNYIDVEIRVMDCHGNWSVSGQNPNFACNVTNTCDPTWPFGYNEKPLGLPDNQNYLYPTDDSAASYFGSWSHSTGAAFMFGSDIHSSTAGNTASVSFTSWSFGLVSEYGPSRGSAKIYVDGVLSRTISLYATANTPPRVVWSYWSAHYGTHIVKVVVVGTAGHPRLDVDGFFIGPSASRP